MSNRPGLIATLRRIWAEHRELCFLLALSLLIREALVLSGGQYYWPDEFRCERYLRLLQAWVHLDFSDGLQFLSWADHPGFFFAAMPASAFQLLVMTLTGGSMQATGWAAAMVLALWPVACIALLYAIVLRSGGSRREALCAALLLASANCFFYYSRHLFPYDSSTAMLLAAMFVGIKPAASRWRSFSMGFLAGLGVLTYLGYWTFAVAVGTLHCFHEWRGLRRAIEKGLAFSAGVLLLPLLLQAITMALGFTPFLQGAAQFSGTIIQGDFAEGWSFPWEFFWHAEFLMALTWLAGIIATLVFAMRADGPARRRGLFWFSAVLLLYVLLAMFSTGLHRFVIYGRTARQMVPFAALAIAAGYEELSSRVQLTPQRSTLAGLLVVLLALINFQSAFLVQYPREIRAQVARQFGPAKDALTTDGTPLASKPKPGNLPLVLVNAQHLFRFKGIAPPPEGTELLRAAHPLTFEPYLYEEFGPVQRAMLRSADISIRLIDTRKK